MRILSIRLPDHRISYGNIPLNPAVSAFPLYNDPTRYFTLVSTKGTADSFTRVRGIARTLASIATGSSCPSFTQFPGSNAGSASVAIKPTRSVSQHQLSFEGPRRKMSTTYHHCHVHLRAPVLYHTSYPIRYQIYIASERQW